MFQEFEISLSSMASRYKKDDDLMFGELPEDDDLNGLGDEAEADANNDETFGGPLPSGTMFDELDDYAAQSADLRLDDVWDTPSCSAAPPASDLPMPSFDFTNFGTSFDFLGTDSKLDNIWGQSKGESAWPEDLSFSKPKESDWSRPPAIVPEVSKSNIPTMPKAPMLEEIEKKAQAPERPRIPTIPSQALSAEELEKKMIQDNQNRNQRPNGTPPMIPSLMGNLNAISMGLCPPIPPNFIPCFVPWLDVLTGRAQSLPPLCPPPPPFVMHMLNYFKNPNMVMQMLQAAVTPPQFIHPPPQPPTAPATPQSGWHQHPRKPPGMPSAKTIEDLAFDQFAGYMSGKERQWLVKIQVLQCQGTNNPYEDDYYYLAWRQKKIAEGMQPKQIKEPERSETKDIIVTSRQNRERRNRERNGSTSETIEPREKLDRVTTLATRFAGSLGIPTKASTHNPRHSIRVQHSNPLDEEEQEKRLAGHQKKLRTLLIRLEAATSLLIQCTDRRIQLQSTNQAHKDTLTAEINERVSTVMKELFQEEFPRVAQVSKGRNLICRIFKVAMPLDISRMIRILIIQARSPLNAKSLVELEEDTFPEIFRGLMSYPREAIVSVVQYLKIDEMLAALNEKNSFVRDLLLLLLLVCSVKKSAPQCSLFQWIRSIGLLDLSVSWSSTEDNLWSLISVNRDSVNNLASWLHLLVSESSQGTIAAIIAHRLKCY